MKKYRRIEINAFRRRVTIVSGEWPRDGLGDAPPQAKDEVSIDDSNQCEPVDLDSPEGQLILAEALRSLERRLLPETRFTIRNASQSSEPNDFNPATEKGI